MRTLINVAVALSVLLGLGASALYYTEAGQNWLLKQGAIAQVGRAFKPIDGLSVLVCGSASPLGNDVARAQACIAVVTPEHFFIFDVGARAPLRVIQAQLPLDRLDGVFLTHFHSDHITGIANINLGSWVQGRREPLTIYGPTGVARVVAGFNQAYGLDRGYRIAHHGEALLPPRAGPMQAQGFAKPGTVWADDKLTIRAFTVSHPPIEPAVGYRIDYAGRSVVISGDSNVSDNLFEVAEGADLVLHDALSRPLLDQMIALGSELDVPFGPQLMTDIIDYHADTLSLAQRAQTANIGQLALYHLVPAPESALAKRIFRRGLPENILLTVDLQRFDLPAHSDVVEISGP